MKLCGNVLRPRRTIATEFGSPFPVLLFLDNSFNFNSLFIHNNSQHNNSFFLDFLNVKVPCSPSVIYQVNQLPLTAIVLRVLWGFRYSFLRVCSPCNFLLTTEVTIRANTMMITNRAIRMPRQLRWFGLLETNWRRKRRRMWRRNKRNGNIRTINLKCAENNAEKYHNKGHVRHIRRTGDSPLTTLGRA